MISGQLRTGVALADATTREVGGEGELRTVGSKGRVECAKKGLA